MNTIDIIQKEESLKLVLHCKTSFWARAILAILSLISFIGFISSIFNSFQQVPFDFLEFFFPFLILSICTFYFVRLFLWNQFGKEIIEIDRNQYTYYHDYGWFQTEKEHIFYRQLYASEAGRSEVQVDQKSPILDEEFTGKKDHLVVDLGETKHESSVSIPLKDLRLLIQSINKFDRRN